MLGDIPALQPRKDVTRARFCWAKVAAERAAGFPTKGLPVLQAAMREALNIHTSPLVQMAFMDFMVETQGRPAIDALARLSRDETAEATVHAL
ncbi:MAG TPA: hypothetical protein VGN07_16020 [Steroidobacteraceae bacterium]|jgi:hypothetical protein